MATFQLYHWKHLPHLSLIHLEVPSRQLHLVRALYCVLCCQISNFELLIVKKWKNDKYTTLTFRSIQMYGLSSDDDDDDDDDNDDHDDDHEIKRT